MDERKTTFVLSSYKTIDEFYEFHKDNLPKILSFDNKRKTIKFENIQGEVDNVEFIFYRNVFGRSYKNVIISIDIENEKFHTIKDYLNGVCENISDI